MWRKSGKRAGENRVAFFIEIYWLSCSRQLTSDAQSISKVVDCADNFYRLTVLKHKMNTEKLSDKQKQENFPFIPKRAA